VLTPEVESGRPARGTGSTVPRVYQFRHLSRVPTGMPVRNDAYAVTHALRVRWYATAAFDRVRNRMIAVTIDSLRQAGTAITAPTASSPAGR